MVGNTLILDKLWQWIRERKEKGTSLRAEVTIHFKIKWEVYKDTVFVLFFFKDKQEAPFFFALQFLYELNKPDITC